MDKDVLTTSEAAKLLGISVRTAQLLIEGGTLTSWKTPGGHRRVYRTEVEALIARTKPAPVLESALVIVVCSPDRQAAYEAMLAAMPECTVAIHHDANTAAFVIGSRLPAAVIVDLDDAPANRLAFLKHIDMNPAFGSIALFASANSDVIASGDLAALRRVTVTSPDRLATALHGVLQDKVAPRDIMVDGASFPLASNEGRRLAALKRSGLVDTAPEDAFDRLTWLASRSLKTPVALLTLLTNDRQWFKSRIGLDMIETPRSWSFCNHTILQKGVFAVSDLAHKAPFDTNPAVAGAPHFRFYAGAPVTDPDGFAVGALCVIDYEPRKLDAEQEKTLLALAALASDELRLRATDRQLRWALDSLERQHERT
ncbi:putative GAF sensor protein [Bradyrhizobium sp. ORS 285]|uniref:excisionase family DNA-binding protein n=1 Tax=Bradyrhizobium sp. ORS 285 TaxID=115808 RepID=UPI0002406D4E|nr:excisionase family DNA-binding protein [Bradyrhizobium sp. ORS 285]CCD86663.1 putative GAF sensor protein [Bradyrhizobium sp. ORS 285]SMX59802.1 putative GAF sensor protein [Bradyrhizobium sp. ORS 285]